jgi:hypothetical protein
MKKNKLTIHEYERFYKIIMNRLEQLRNKTKEYGKENDIFDNFNRASSILNMPPEDVIVCYKTKHTVSIDKIKEELLNGEKFDNDFILEKVCDSVMYEILLGISLLNRNND